MKYDNFEDWFNEIINFSMRSEHYDADLNLDRDKFCIFVKFMKEAFDAGKEQYNR